MSTCRLATGMPLATLETVLVVLASRTLSLACAPTSKINGKLMTKKDAEEKKTWVALVGKIAVAVLGAMAAGGAGSTMRPFGFVANRLLTNNRPRGHTD